MSDVEVNLSGPIFDGRAAEAAKAYTEEVMDDVAQQSFADWLTLLNDNIRQPTPYYETQINIRSGGGSRIVNDRGIIYGPWLEGTGSRNSPVTRFPGYRAARNTTAAMREFKAEDLAEHLLHRKYLRRMG